LGAFEALLILLVYSALCDTTSHHIWKSIYI